MRYLKFLQAPKSIGECKGMSQDLLILKQL